jgi:hypothetical protein
MRELHQSVRPMLHCSASLQGDETRLKLGEEVVGPNVGACLHAADLAHAPKLGSGTSGNLPTVEQTYLYQKVNREDVDATSRQGYASMVRYMESCGRRPAPTVAARFG